MCNSVYRNVYNSVYRNVYNSEYQNVYNSVYRWIVPAGLQVRALSATDPVS